MNAYEMKMTCGKCAAYECIQIETTFGEVAWNNLESLVFAKGWTQKDWTYLCPSCAKALSACPFDGCDDHQACMICQVDEAMGVDDD